MAWSDDLYRIHFPVDGELHLRMLVAGYGTINTWWHGCPQGHPFWVLYANDDGGAELTLPGGQVLALAADHIWLLPPWSVYNAHCLRAVGHSWIHFDPIGLAPMAVRQLCPAPLGFPRDALLNAGLAELRTAALSPTIDQFELRCIGKSLALAAMVRLWRTLPNPARQRLTLTSFDGQLGPALQRIEQHLREPLYSRSLAEACGLSPAHFARRFRAATGLSPMQFVLERRIAHAAELLLLGDDPIETIADALGFQDRFYFTRVFTRRMGSSPAAYRARSGLAAPPEAQGAPAVS